MNMLLWNFYFYSKIYNSTKNTYVNFVQVPLFIVLELFWFPIITFQLLLYMNIYCFPWTYLRNLCSLPSPSRYKFLSDEKWLCFE